MENLTNGGVVQVIDGAKLGQSSRAASEEEAMLH